MERKLSFSKIIALVVVTIVALMFFGWALGWFAAPLQATSADNVRKQFAFAYQYEESLNAAALQYCTSRDARDRTERGSEAHTQRETQVIAIEQNYSRIAAEYNAKLSNAFEAKLVAPPDVPKRAPTLAENVAKLCVNDQ